jgi:rare lipoprotein A
LKSALKVIVTMAVFVGALAISPVATDDAKADPWLASWYGPGFAGYPTASGEIFDPYALTAAHPTLPFGTELQVCYSACTVVRVNDRGPYTGGRDIDLSQGASDAVGLTPVGVDYVDVEILGYGYY